MKGLDGLFELLGGLFLVIVSPAELNRWAHDITQHELSEDPHNFLANHLLHITQNLHHTQFLGAIYLLSHGAAKLIMVVGLWLEKGWSYPFAFVFLTLFIAFQLYELILKPSAGLALLTAFDGLIFVAHLARIPPAQESSGGIDPRIDHLRNQSHDASTSGQIKAIRTQNRRTIRPPADYIEHDFRRTIEGRSWAWEVTG